MSRVYTRVWFLFLNRQNAPPEGAVIVKKVMLLKSLLHIA